MDLARQARLTVSASDRSKKARRLLTRWERAPNRIDIRGVDTRRRGIGTRPARRVRRRLAPVDTPKPRAPVDAVVRRPRPSRTVKRAPSGGVRFTPARGVPKETTALIREYLAAVQSGRPVPKELQKRAREDEFLADKGVPLTPPGKPRVSPIRHDPDAPPRPKPGPGDITVRFDGKQVDWLGMSARERRKLLRSAPAARVPRGTATRSVQAEAWRELRQFRTHLTRDAFRKAQAAMRAVMQRVEDQGDMVVTEDQRRAALATIRSEFGKEMKRRHKDFGPAWGRRRGTL